nr:unnamed protein product [Digitaria exilis]
MKRNQQRYQTCQQEASSGRQIDDEEEAAKPPSSRGGGGTRVAPLVLRIYWSSAAAMVTDEVSWGGVKWCDAEHAHMSAAAQAPS